MPVLFVVTLLKEKRGEKRKDMCIAVHLRGNEIKVKLTHDVGCGGLVCNGKMFDNLDVFGRF